MGQPLLPDLARGRSQLRQGEEQDHDPMGEEAPAWAEGRFAVPELIAKIESHQPFRSGKDAPKHPLAVLQELNNTDKHRRIHFLLPTADFFTMQSRWNLAQQGNQFMSITRKVAPRVGEGRHEVARLHLHQGVFTKADLDDKPTFLFDVTFDYGPPAYGQRIMATTEALFEAVQNVLLDFDSDFPPASL